MSKKRIIVLPKPAKFFLKDGSAVEFKTLECERDSLVSVQCVKCGICGAILSFYEEKRILKCALCDTEEENYYCCPENHYICKHCSDLGKGSFPCLRHHLTTNKIGDKIIWKENNMIDKCYDTNELRSKAMAKAQAKVRELRAAGIPITRETFSIILKYCYAEARKEIAPASNELTPEQMELVKKLIPKYADKLFVIKEKSAKKATQKVIKTQE